MIDFVVECGFRWASGQAEGARIDGWFLRKVARVLTTFIVTRLGRRIPRRRHK
jgi:hypothetical protein